ncbi:MAG TPA: HAMP domain-containing sensor histidine kinase [Rhizomicrobium sp.]|nr:HAMP domain-containing sensor histidine kinase [Rhizomicrobium sp.]
MFREKLIATLGWSALCIAGAMLADYLVTVVIANDARNYTPLITFVVATLVTLPTSYVLISSRIDLRKTRDDLAAARDAAINADKTKTQFFANMSHELRTPLNAILGFSELLALDVFASRREEYAQLIHNAGTHLLSLVNDLLDLSRIEAGKLELCFEPVDLAAILEECADTLAVRIRKRGLRLAQNIQSDLPQADADARSIRQIVLNLLTNAIKFSKSSGTIELFANITPTGALAFGVRDEGVGISEAEQAHVFERFGQARESKSAEKGSGLGLPIVRGLVEAHGGSVEMKSRLDHGTTVIVTLPAERMVPAARIALAS